MLKSVFLAFYLLKDYYKTGKFGKIWHNLSCRFELQHYVMVCWPTGHMKNHSVQLNLKVVGPVGGQSTCHAMPIAGFPIRVMPCAMFPEWKTATVCNFSLLTSFETNAMYVHVLGSKHYLSS